MTITGHFDEFGYDIRADGQPIYNAGNHALDSQQDGTGTEQQLSISTIKVFCLQTAKELASERGDTFGGCESN